MEDQMEDFFSFLPLPGIPSLGNKIPQGRKQNIQDILFSSLRPFFSPPRSFIQVDKL